MLDEGETVWFEKGEARKGQKVETKNIYVDAYGVGDVGNVVLRDRKTISTEGILVVVLVLDKTEGWFRSLVLFPAVLYLRKKKKLF